MAATTAPAASAAQALFKDAVTHHLADDSHAAIALYSQALREDPTIAEAYNNLATLLAQRGDDAEAERLLQRAVTLQPDYGEAHNNLGILYASRGDHARALPAFQRAVALEGGHPQWLNNLGNACVEHFRFADALAAYDRALSITPNDPECWSNRGLALRGLRRPDDAIASFQRALSMAPAHVNALSNLGIVLKEQKRLDEAVSALIKATEIDPANVHLWANLSAVHEARGDYDRMRQHAAQAAALDPSYPESYNLLANCEMEAGRYSDALALYERAISLDPDNRNANWNLALIWLLRGEFDRGWRQFEWRKRLQSVVFDHGDYGPNEWTGESLAGRDILLHSEQGIGDAIQFVRYAQSLKARGARRVYLECPYPIAPLLTGVRGVDAVVARGTPLPSYDVHANLMSLPALVQTTLDSVPADVPYIPVEPRTARALVAAPEGTLTVGFVWAGNPIHARDFLRSAPLDLFRPLAQVEGARFFSLQKGAAAERELAEHPVPGVTNLAPHLDDFRDTAAVIDALDLVITVDTSVAHLAGALGKETWLLLPHVPDFRWMLERDDSPWYPTMRLFRQAAPRDWGSVFEAVERALRERIGRGAVVPRAGIVSDDAVVTLAAATRLPDGRPRFDLWFPLAMLARPALFAEYEGELLGQGHDVAIRAFLDEFLVAGDVVVDVAPGLGLTSLSVATATSPPAALAVVDRDPSNTRRIVDLLARRAPSLAVASTTTVSDALDDASSRGRVVLRVGDARLADDVIDAIGQCPAAARPHAIAWSSLVPAEGAGGLALLESLGYVTVSLSLANGEPSLDAIVDTSRAQALVTLSPEALDALENCAAPAVPAIGTTTIGIDWELRADTGWGVYGTHLALELERDGGVAPAIFAADTTGWPPIARFRLERALREGSDRAGALQRARGPMHVDALMLRALGNNLAHGPLWGRVTARRNVGVIFFEDSAFDSAALRRAGELDLIIAGSRWNEQVLRARGVTNVATVLQGVDPAVFHPAPRSGLLADRFVIFSGGKLEYRKGQDLVVAAFRAFRERHPEALLLTAWHNNWPQLIADLDLASHVQGAPQLRDGRLEVGAWLEANGVPAAAVLDVGRTPNALMGQVMREADVALFPNRCEGGTNLVAMECMAAGVPTIVSDNTGHQDLVATGGCIPLSHQRPVRAPTQFYRGVDDWGESDIEEMVEALERVYADRTAVTPIARTGAEVMSRMGWSHQVRQLLATLSPLL